MVGGVWYLWQREAKKDFGLQSTERLDERMSVLDKGKKLQWRRKRLGGEICSIDRKEEEVWFGIMGFCRAATSVCTGVFLGGGVIGP